MLALLPGNKSNLILTEKTSYVLDYFFLMSITELRGSCLFLLFSSVASQIMAKYGWKDGQGNK